MFKNGKSSVTLLEGNNMTMPMLSQSNPYCWCFISINIVSCICMKLYEFISQCIILIILNMFSPITTYYGFKTCYKLPPSWSFITNQTVSLMFNGSYTRRTSSGDGLSWWSLTMAALVGPPPRRMNQRCKLCIHWELGHVCFLIIPSP